VGTAAKVQRCTVTPDNTVGRADQANIHALLNPKDWRRRAWPAVDARPRIC
jgi:hypothetical protein